MTNVRDLSKWVKTVSRKDLQLLARKLSGHYGQPGYNMGSIEHGVRLLLLLVMMIMVSSAQVISVTGVNQKIADP